MGSAYLEGPLSKWTNVMKGWQYRWFVLDDNAGLLSYYTSRDKMIRGSRRGCVRLSNAIIGIDDEDDSTFTITVDLKIFHFQARDYEERKQWASALEDTILRHSQRQLEPMLSEPSFVDFDNQLAEADAYLQLLIKNVKELQQKVEVVENTSEKQNMESILMSALEMVEAVKKSIVLLQLAKNAINSKQNTHHIVQPAVLPASNGAAPVESVLISTVASHSEGSQVEVNVDNDANSITHEPSVDSNSATNEPSADSISDTSTTDQQVEQIDSLPVSNLSVIPPTSYSSSEEEDDEFYDADEDMRSLSSRRSKASLDKYTKSPPKSPNRSKKPEISQSNGDNNTTPVTTKSEEEENKLPPQIQTPMKENNDDLYMEEDVNSAKEGESVEEHKSVIMHLLSQVKLGMDLTKVVLPTFILERRSLLEMYADFFAHADLFLNIVDQKTAEKRMIETVRFYLSTFAAGRNSSVAKKPYNPILGESFQCLWNLNSANSSGNNDQSIRSEAVSDGPVPWAVNDELAFLAEQVSHHPPISAFYAEHKGKRIQFNGHIWTKSKFLGLSIGVHNIGQGCVTLLDHDEEYIVNFPNGYGRSILTIPWVELGGDCTITCEKTGYNAFVKFHTKPFYGGKPHRILVEIFAPNVKKPICTVDGEWNDVMWAHYASGKNEKFIDTKNKAKITKKVRKLESQMATESRKLWDKVTINLKANNIDAATEGKRALEDKQRKDAKHRLENGIVYKPKLFYEDDCQNWIYHAPLTGRINSS